MSAQLDTIIIGAGSAGLAALREVKKNSSHFLMVNHGAWGTTCARVGCMPSKALIEAANAFHSREGFEALGLRGASALSADVPAVLARVRELRDSFVASTLKATNMLGASSLSGHARLLGPTSISVDGQRYEARSLIIATGSRPKVPAAWRALGDRILTTDTLFEQTQLGPRMAVIGMGVIGVEIAQALARLGIEVTAFASGHTVAGLQDPALNALMQSVLHKEMALHTATRPELHAIDGGIEVRSGAQRWVVDQVLVATGRTPNIEGLGLEALGVPLNERGLPTVNPHTLQVGDLPVFMPGDVNTHMPLLHEAADEGYIAGLNALAPSPTCFQRRTRLGIVFCDPNVAMVGQRLSELEPQHTVTGSVDFRNQGRARTAQRNQGRLFVYADRASGRLRGAELCAPGGEHLAHLLGLAIQHRLTVHEMLSMPFYHPTLEEGLRSALRDAAHQLPHGPVSDLASCNALDIAALE